MEIEAKYLVPDRATFDALLSLDHLDAYGLHELGEQSLTDHYYDTGGGALRQAGYALRLREVAGQPQWVATLKGLAGAEGALHAREELEAQAPPGALPVDWPDGPARELALRLAGAEPLRELFALCQRRHRRAARHGDDEVAELSLDEVAFTAPAEAPPTYELEVELKGAGTRDDLQALAASLSDYGLRPQPESKFARGLQRLEGPQAPEAPPAAPSRPKSPGVRADETMAEAGRKVLRFHFDRMLAKEDGVRRGDDVEAVHDMRVATRRQRAALRLFQDYYRRKELRPFEDGLKALAERLGAVRDLDVMLEDAREHQSHLPEAEAAGLQPLLDAWTAERDTAHAGLLAHLDSREYRKLAKAGAKFLETPGAGVRRGRSRLPRPVLVRQVVPGRLWDHYGLVRAYEIVLPDAPLDLLHALRIEGKRLRYALEFFAEVLDPSLAEAIRVVVALQDHLGELHDADVAVNRLQAFRTGLPLQPDQAVIHQALRGYLRARQTRLRALQRTVGRPWRAVMSRRFRRLLARAVALL